MQLLKSVITFLLLIVAVHARSQNAEVVRKYIETYKDLAIEEMLRTGVPASITLAQGIHESGAGNSRLATKANNHFGIKCKSNWTGESIKHDDDARNECFRKYTTAEESYKDHSDFLKNGVRYASLFTLDPVDYAGWADGLKKAGYATNPKYPQVLVKLIEDYGLQEYSLIALNRSRNSNNDVVAVSTSNVKSETIVTASHNEAAVEKPERPDYPTGEFKINDTKVVFVKKGTSFIWIAKKYDVDLSKIFEFNDIPRAEETEKDQLIYLQRKRKTGAVDFHFVTNGETLQDIAQAEGIRLESLMELNLLEPGEQPATGQKLHLKTKATLKPAREIKGKYSLLPGRS